MPHIFLSYQLCHESIFIGKECSEQGLQLLHLWIYAVQQGDGESQVVNCSPFTVLLLPREPVPLMDSLVLIKAVPSAGQLDLGRNLC